MPGRNAQSRPVKIGRPRVDSSAATGDARNDILRAAVDLISKKGVAKTTVTGIAELAKLRPPSIYHYFDGKADILAQVAVEANAGPIAMAHWINQQQAPAAVRLWAFVALDVTLLSKLPFDINEVHRTITVDPELAQVYDFGREELIECVATLLRSGIADGQLRDVSVPLAVMTILGNDEGSQNWLRRPGEVDPVEAARHVADSALLALTAVPLDLPATRAAGQQLVDCYLEPRS